MLIVVIIDEGFSDRLFSLTEKFGGVFIGGPLLIGYCCYISISSSMMGSCNLSIDYLRYGSSALPVSSISFSVITERV